jgi:ABC-2 type transport system ATP-binding protein
LRQRRLDLKLSDDVPNSAILAQVFQVLFDNKISLICVRTVGAQTEQAYLDLMEREESKGFTRLFQPAEAA